MTSSKQEELPEDNSVESELELKVQSQEEELINLQTRLSFIEETLRKERKKRGVFHSLFGEGGLSTTGVAILSSIVAIVLGFVIFNLVRGVQWRAALAELRSEPGIHILSVRTTGPMTRQVFGLRDPLSRNPLDILTEHDISPERVDLQLAEFHSLNTEFDRRRQEKQESDLEALRNTMVGVLGSLSEESRQQRNQDLGRISQLLLEMRFPEAMRKLKLNYSDGVWYAEGELSENEFHDFKTLAPRYILNGEVDLDNIGNYTEALLVSLSGGIQKPNLLDRDYDGNFAHVPRVARLIRNYDQVKKTVGDVPGRLSLTLYSDQPGQHEEAVNEVADRLTDLAQLSETRIRVEPALPRRQGDEEDTLLLKLAMPE